MELSSATPKVKKLSYMSGANMQSLKTNKKTLFWKNFLVFSNDFTIFTASLHQVHLQIILKILASFILL